MACYDGARRLERPLTLPCETCSKPFSTTRRTAKSPPRFCSSKCFGASLRKPVETIVCAQCGKERSYPAGAAQGHFLCSHECSGLYRRKQVDRTCQQCGISFTRWPSAVARGAGVYCSRRCAGNGRLRPQELRCARCDVSFLAWPFKIRRGRRFCSHACAHAAARESRPRMSCKTCGREITVFPYMGGTRKFCSWGCYVKDCHENSSSVIVCQVCGTDKRVPAFRLAEGYGKYCSRACYACAQRVRVSLECRQCHRRFLVVPSLAGQRRYCRRRCAALARAPHEHRCRVCKATFRAPAWRQQRYCGLSCSNSGRERRRSPEKERRNARIVELRTEGLDAFRIAQRLEVEMGTAVSPATVRTILFRARARRGPHERNETPIAAAFVW